MHWKRRRLPGMRYSQRNPTKAPMINCYLDRPHGTLALHDMSWVFLEKKVTLAVQ